MAKLNTWGSAFRLAVVMALVAIGAQLWAWSEAGAQASFSPYQNAVLADGPTVFLTFDNGSLENVAGDIEVTREGTDVEFRPSVQLTYTGDTAFGAGQSMTISSQFEDFVGSDPAFVVPTDAGGDLLTQAITIEALIKVDGEGDAITIAQVGTRFVNSPFGALDGGGFFVGMEERLFYDQMAGVAFDSVTDPAGQQVFTIDPISYSEWQHVAFTHALVEEFSGPPGPNGPTAVVVGGVARMFVNGFDYFEVSTDGTIPFAPDAPFALVGPTVNDLAADYQTDPMFIDEYAIYPEALSQERIADHAQLAFDEITTFPLPFRSDLGSVPFDSATSAEPWCLVQIEDSSSACFESSSNRETYIQEELLGNSDYGTIWIGRFDEEVVAP